MMFAILETGSKQYKVSEGDVLEVELLDKAKISSKNLVKFDSVLLVKDKTLHIGQPFVKGAQIDAKILEELKSPKIIVFKKKSKKQYKRTKGHRQKLHKIQIEKIAIQKTTKPKPKTTPKPKPKTTKKEKE
jgi:large subunit ribosomal protein L21